MIITPLGHTEFLVDIVNHEGENVRILVDSWLSDFATGDLMERTVQFRIDREKMATIDAIYISHAHTDHLDPYTLIEIYNSCHREVGSDPANKSTPYNDWIASQARNDRNFPILILPVTVGYLAPLLTEYLPNAPIHWLSNHEAYILKGIEITGYMFPQSEITNEDDVMMIGIANETELIFAEIDTVPDAYDSGVQESLFRIFTRRDYDTACYLASRNELEGQLKMYDLPKSKQSIYRDQYRSERKEEIRASYEKYEYEEYADFPNLMTLPGFVRGYIGQGMRYPESLSPELASLSIFPLDEIASLESDIAKTFGYEFPQKALLPGRQYKIEKGSIETGRKECPIGKIVKSEEGKVKDKALSSKASFLSSRQSLSVPVTNDERSCSGKDLSTSLIPRFGRDDKSERLYAAGPLFPRDYNPESIEVAKKQILEVLNHRFLPYWSGSPVASLRDALLKNKDGCYRIELKVPVIARHEAIQENKEKFLSDSGLLFATANFRHSSQGRGQIILFEYSYASTLFIEVPYDEGMRIDEDYWLDDILDFLDGRQDLYSNFWHKLDPQKIYRLWTCLGANSMNNDLVMKKYRLHFERAIRGETAEGFVRAILERIQ